jgi:hypothetical protein
LIPGSIIFLLFSFNFLTFLFLFVPLSFRNQESKFFFEEYAQWLPQLFNTILLLGKEILAHENKSDGSNNNTSNSNRPGVTGFMSPTGSASAMNSNSSYFMENSSFFPLLMIIEEMEEILSFVRFPSQDSRNSNNNPMMVQSLQEFRQHYSFGYQLITNLSLSSSMIIEYYFMIFNHWITKTYDKQLQLLMIIIYLLLEWVRKTNEYELVFITNALFLNFFFVL